MNDATRRTLHRLLDAGTDFAPEYGGGLSSHLPMALQALQALGASSERLEAFQAAYAPRLTARGRAGGGGRPDRYEPLTREISGEVRRAGRDTVLRRRLPDLLQDPGAAAFHGLIRVAHGAAAGHDDELARGLAYWSALHRPASACAGLGTSVAPQLSLEAWLERLRALRAGQRVAGRRIAWRMQSWRELRGFEAAAASLVLDDAALPALARAAARLYARTGDFTVLHVVTGCHALSVLGPWIADPAAALSALRPAAAAALLASEVWESVAPADAVASPPPPWDELVRGALASDDEHVIKLVHACSDWAHRADQQPDTVFAQAAARALS